MIRENQQQESQSQPGFSSLRSKQFQRQAVGRLYQAIVNRAILDALECGENPPAAENWLLSRDFDRLQELFS